MDNLRIETNMNAGDMRTQLRKVYQDMQRHAKVQLAQLEQLSDCEIQDLFTCLMMTDVEELANESDIPFSLN